MRFFKKILLIRGILPLLAFLFILSWTPQKAQSVTCCAMGGGSPPVWGGYYDAECPTSQEEVEMRERTWTPVMGSCQTIPLCPNIVRDCTYSSSSTVVTIQDSDCTGAVTNSYTEYELRGPGSSEAECFWNCANGENPWVHLSYGDCP